MDEFGVLVESIGFRANGKSAPLADLKHKPKPKSHFAPHGAANTPSFHDSGSLPVDELDGIFRSNVTVSQQPHESFGTDDIFGGPVSSSNQYGGIDLESVFSGSSNNRKNSSSSLNSMNSVGSNGFEELLGSMGSKSRRSGSVDDLFGSVEVNMKQEKHVTGFDDLISGFGGASPSKTEVKSKPNGRPSNPSSTVIDDPFLIFESSAPQSANHWPFDGPLGNSMGKGSVQTEIDDFDDFIMGGARRDSKVAGMRNTPDKASFGTASNGFGNTDYVDEIFGGGGHAKQNNAARSSAVAENSSFDDFFPQKKVPEAKGAPSNASVSRKKASVPASMGDDFTSLFGDITTSSGEFQEIDGEPEDRRKARLNRHMRTNARMAEALAEKNERDLQHQRAQEEKHRLAQTLDDEVRRWAAGKEGNLRALLSSLQQILGPECGWRPVSLTDMITSESVKRAFKKANLHVHPDKVQQKGADVRQQYIAEKVFDLLKEAWNKFSTEELR